MLNVNEKHEKCLECNIIPCINLYRKVNEHAGGELYVILEHNKPTVYPPCHLGILIYVICQLLNEVLDSVSLPLYIQCVRDLKASIFLTLTGHYRTAIQILRSVIEMYLAALYFDEKYHRARNDEEREIVTEQIKKFYEEKYKIPEQEYRELFPKEKRIKRYLDYGYLIEWLFKKKVIDGKTRNSLEKLMGTLNKYIHTRGGPYLTVLKPHCPACPAAVKLDPKEYEYCAQLIQTTCAHLLDILLTKINTKKPNVKETLMYLIGLEKLEKEINKKLIFSKKLRKTINRIFFSLCCDP